MPIAGTSDTLSKLMNYEALVVATKNEIGRIQRQMHEAGFCHFLHAEGELSWHDSQFFVGDRKLLSCGLDVQAEFLKKKKYINFGEALRKKQSETMLALEKLFF